MAISDMRQSWRSGIAVVKKYDPGMGAAYYLTKNIESDAIDYDVSG